MSERIPIATQLFAVRAEVDQDLPATLAELAKIGFDGAEPWGYDGAELAWKGHPAADIRKMYDDNGLVCCGCHLAPEALTDNLERTIEFNQVLGNRFLIIAMDKQRMTSVEGIAELAGILNAAAERLTPLKMYCGYHAHGFDFDIVDGQVAWDRLFSQTAPEVIMQMDVGNCLSGGGDPYAMLEKFPNRARSMQLKDFNTGPDGAIGDGEVDWPRVFSLCQTRQNVEWYVLEQGSKDGSGFDIPRRSLEAVRAMGK